MTETPAAEDLPPEPTETRVEAAARIAAESAVAALLPRLQDLENRPEPSLPAVPADLESRLAGLENALRLLIESPPAPAPLADEDRKTIDDLRLAAATSAREIRLLKKENG